MKVKTKTDFWDSNDWQHKMLKIVQSVYALSAIGVLLTIITKYWALVIHLIIIIMMVLIWSSYIKWRQHGKDT